MRVAVIMSTYNGEMYLREQLNSILKQEGIDVELFVRDDGSTDKTIDILEEFASVYSNIHLNKGENIGFRQSFIKELSAHDGFDYYAFSDQDDFWEKEKLISGCKMILNENPENKPCVYYSNLYISDENLNVYKTTKLEKRKQTLESITLRRSIAGCTMVLNYQMWKQIAKRKITNQMLLRGHDSFIMSLCYSLGGKVLCDSNAYIKYRQHSDNTSGGMHGPIQRIKKEYKALLLKKGQESKIASAILSEWDDCIALDKKKILQTIRFCKKFKVRLLIFFSKRYVTGDLRLTILGKLKVIFGVL